MTTYRITARNPNTGVVIYVGPVNASGVALAIARAKETYPRYALGFVLKAEPMLLRFPNLPIACRGPGFDENGNCE